MKFLSSLILLLLINPALAESCPPGAPSCKVVVLTPDEEKVLLGERGIFDTAAQARQLDLANLVIYFRNKIQSAPAGTVPAPVLSGDTTPPSTSTPEAVPVPKPDPRK